MPRPRSTPEVSLPISSSRSLHAMFQLLIAIICRVVTIETWRKISLFVALPACAIVGYVSLKEEFEHIHHVEHDPPTFTAYPYLHVRKRKFPYGDGDHTPFWNPIMNPEPED
ncbi:Cytochrome c oxidase subunit 6A1, mitochondrial [Coemansia sp. RSA 2440]|nr:Cytochrome c oxidase subunit 6A1, mitochondrial [Coemansia sp. RSA 2440]